jgi:tetratricopeptide (TPR) repeat protein
MSIMMSTRCLLNSAALLAALSVDGAWAKTATEVFEAAAPSVVTVHVQDTAGKPKGLGSGVVIGRGEIVTNCHVLEVGSRYTIKHEGREYPAVAKYTDWDHDVCSLTVSGLAASPASLGTTQSLKVGQKVYAIGAPKGLELTLSEGIVSSFREVGRGRYLQITAPISPGSSGGGLFDDEGRLIGLPTFYLSGGQQLNFAVPVEWVQALPQSHSAQPTQSRPAQSVSQWLARAIALEERKDWAALLKHAQAWTRSRATDAKGWYVLGIAYSESGQTANAIEAYQKALRIHPVYVKAWYNLAVLYDESAQTAKAIEAYQQALRIDPQEARAWYNLGVVYGKSGQPSKAIEAYQQALRIDPQDPKAWHNLGHAYGESGQTAKAIEALEQALRINPQYTKVWINLGVAYSASRQTEKAIEALEQALRIDPQDANAWYNLGIAYRRSGQTGKAIEAFQESLRIDPQDANAWYNLGVAYHVEGRRSEVMRVYQALKRMDSKVADKFFDKVVLP